MEKTSIRALVALTTLLSMLAVGTASASPNVPTEDRPSNASSAADYWSAERRAQAIPRDLVIDHRGFGYLRLPDGSVEPYGHDVAATAAPLRALPAPNVKPTNPGGGGSSDPSDGIGPTVSDMDPAKDATIGNTHTFSATVTDDSGVKSVTFHVGLLNSPTSTQSFSASSTDGTTWTVTLQGFTDGDWQWQVEATDGARRGGNTSTEGPVGFTVSTSTSGDGGGTDTGTVTNQQWTQGGTVQTAAGRIYFEMPANPPMTKWNGYVCSGTVVTDGISGRSIILTAAHCVYDDQYKVFARNVLFIPNQDGTSAAGTDLNCNNDPLGCWEPSFGVVDSDWTTATFPANIPWDYAYYVVSDSGSHSGTHTSTDILDGEAESLTISFVDPGFANTTAAIGYSYSDDPNLMYCQEGLGTESSYNNWWLGSCELSGGSSGGPWLQPVQDGSGTIISVNSWGYRDQPGMAGPRLNETSASCLFEAAKAADITATGLTPGC